ncbi:MAG: hypothetical protein K2M69_03350 [Muribaculaceae bacterium]|nr:hypothetical protein [Muribaculaceae bacterium]
MKSKPILSGIFFIAFSMASIFFSGCSTGIEGTKTITYSKSEKKVLTPTQEEKIVADISPSPLKDWKTGRRFLVSDDRAALIFESLPPGTSLKGRELLYEGYEERMTPGGKKSLVIIFGDGSRSYSYPTGKLTEEGLASVTSLDIPMLVDLETVAIYKQRLEGLKAWTRSTLRYDENGEKRSGRRFVPVTIKAVSPGDILFLIHLEIEEENGESSLIYMNPSHRGLESRTFSDLFFLSDPKMKHPGIAPDVWDLICQGKVKTGMTKEECKLALGNPDDVASGHDWNQTVDIWNYRDGVFLQFQDGLLTKFRI